MEGDFLFTRFGTKLIPTLSLDPKLLPISLDRPGVVVRAGTLMQVGGERVAARGIGSAERLAAAIEFARWRSSRDA